MKTLGLIIAIFGVAVIAQRRPPNYSQEEMPNTSFNCRDKIIGGYYADPETDCQMFHVCVKVPGLGVQDFKFLCPNDTSFDQENQICDDWYNIDCETATLYYSDNFDLYRIGSEGSNKVRHGNVNNAVSDVEDDVYLQHRSDRGENVGKDLLRGSQSGNFFSNRGGRDDDEEYNKSDLYKPKKKQVNKAPVRKPTSRQTTYAPSTTTTTEAPYRAPAPRGFNQARNFRGNQQPQRTPEPTTTERQRQTEVYERQRGGGFYSQTTAKPQEFFRTDSQRASASTFRPSYNTQDATKSAQQNTFNQNQYTPTTIKPSTFNRNFFEAQTQVTQKQSQPQQPQQNFYNQQGTTYRPNYSFATASTQAPIYDTRKTFDYTQTTKRPYDFSGFQSTATTSYIAQTSKAQTYNRNSNPSTQDYTLSSTPNYSGFDTQQNTEKSNQYATQKLYKINLNAAVGGFQNNNNDDRYDDGDEFLKTAHSQNLAQSNFNRVQQSFNKGYNTSVSASYNFPPTTTSTTTRAPTYATVPSRGRGSAVHTTDATEKPRPFTSPSPPLLKKKEQDQAYDYAYYDDGTASEYENVENVEEFRRTTSRKRSA